MYDIAIIGAGPAGLFSAFQAGTLGLSTIIIDTLEYPGGQCSALYPEKPIYDIPALPSIKAEDLTQNLLKQIERFSPNMQLGTFVTDIHKLEDGTFSIKATKHGTNIDIHSKTVIIAIGGGSFGPNRPPLEGIETFENKTVFYMINNKKQFEGKKVVIAGGGDSAVDWAIVLAPIAEVAIVHRRNKFRAHESSLQELNSLIDSKKVTLHAPYQMKSIAGKDGALQNICLENIEDSTTKDIKADFLLPFFGLSMDIGPASEWGLEFEGKYIKVEHSTMKTNIEGIFAIGDIASYAGKLKLILCGFSEAATACYSARKHIFPEKSFHFEYSTTAFGQK